MNPRFNRPLEPHTLPQPPTSLGESELIGYEAAWPLDARPVDETAFDADPMEAASRLL